MTPDDLAAIRDRNRKHIASEQTRSDVRALLAEVDRLTASIRDTQTRLLAEVDDLREQRSAARLGGLADGRVEERSRIEAEVECLRVMFAPLPDDDEVTARFVLRDEVLAAIDGGEG